MTAWSVVEPPSPFRWYLLTTGFVASALLLLVSARAARLDRAGVGTIAAILVYGAAASLLGALFRRTVFRMVAGADVLVLLFLVLWGAWWLLPMAALIIGALFSPRPSRDRRSAVIVAGGVALAGMAVAAAVSVVPPDQPPLWACYPPGSASADTNAVFAALSRTAGRGRDLLPGVDGISVRAEGVRVDIDPYVGDNELEDIRRLMAGSPGVSEVRSGAPCPV